VNTLFRLVRFVSAFSHSVTSGRVDEVVTRLSQQGDRDGGGTIQFVLEQRPGPLRAVLFSVLRTYRSVNANPGPCQTLPRTTVPEDRRHTFITLIRLHSLMRTYDGDTPPCSPAPRFAGLTSTPCHRTTSEDYHTTARDIIGIIALRPGGSSWIMRLAEVGEDRNHRAATTTRGSDPSRFLRTSFGATFCLS
jgi:hypothetical protein